MHSFTKEQLSVVMCKHPKNEKLDIRHIDLFHTAFDS